ncbi:MAG TPA: carbohydrate ABC transporter permease [Candidatus Limiplasma sp.]|nr:carbohydrate ABC transporter permease [Candidatus Limiplasma sp.]HRX08469.1 carbohydrate ABC transporter permease [Candidatus Limiplasma sp.]
MVKAKSSKIGDIIIVAICVLLILICFLPVWNVFVRSLSSPAALVRSDVYLWPKEFDLTAYSLVLKDAEYTWALAWTAMLTVGCTLLSMALTILCAFPLIFEQLKGRKAINALILVTMYFNAGTIPSYILFKNLNLINSPLVMVLPYSLSVFNMIIMRTFLQNIPVSLRESAEIDGANPFRILVSIYLPLSTSVIATLSLFYAVGRWNGYADALMFMNRNKPFYPIQLLLYFIIQSKDSVDAATQEGFSSPGASDAIKAASVMIATIPILMIYPWLQRFFIHGVTLGAMKG